MRHFATSLHMQRGADSEAKRTLTNRRFCRGLRRPHLPLRQPSQSSETYFLVFGVLQIEVPVTSLLITNRHGAGVDSPLQVRTRIPANNCSLVPDKRIQNVRRFARGAHRCGDWAPGDASAMGLDRQRRFLALPDGAPTP